MERLPTQKDFEANLNEAFVIHFSDELAIEAKLTSIIELKRSDQLESFSLLFSVPDAPVIQNTYLVENAALGSFNLFMVPLGQTANGVKYEAIFCNLISEERPYS